MRAERLVAISWICALSASEALRHTVSSKSHRNERSALKHHESKVGATYETRYWPEESGSENPILAPETEKFPSNIAGLALSGGGTRAYLLGMGYLRGLFMLGLIPHDNLKYLSTSSGSAWAGAAFTYFQGRREGFQEFLGAPETDFGDTNAVEKLFALHGNLGWKNHIPCFKVLRNRFSPLELFKYAKLSRRWNTFSHLHLKDAGIGERDVMAADMEHKMELDKQLDGLARVIAPVLPGMPMFTTVSVVVTAQDWIHGGEPIIPVFEPPCPTVTITPRYTGSLLTERVAFNSRDGKQHMNMTYGGLVETFAFGMDFVEFTTRGKARVKMNRRHVPFSLADAVALVTNAPMVTFLKNQPGVLFKAKALRYVGGVSESKEHYWSPSAQLPGSIFTDTEQKNQALWLGDGGSLENIPVIEQILRGVRCIVAISMPDVDINVNFDWSNPNSETGVKLMEKGSATETAIGFDIASFFGLTKNYADISFEVRHNQVFPESEWIPLVKQLQAKRANEELVIVTMEHTTVQNDYWGVKAGTAVRVTWVYTSPDKNFPLVADPAVGEAYEKHVGRSFQKTWDNFYSGKSTFPQPGLYFTQMQNIPAGISNPLHAFGSWSMLEYRQIFKDAFNCQVGEHSTASNSSSHDAAAGSDVDIDLAKSTWMGPPPNSDLSSHPTSDADLDDDSADSEGSNAVGAGDHEQPEPATQNDVNKVAKEVQRINAVEAARRLQNAGH